MGSELFGLLVVVVGGWWVSAACLSLFSVGGWWVVGGVCHMAAR